MIGLILGVIGIGYLCGKANESCGERRRSYEEVNETFKLTYYNYKIILKDYDIVDSYAKRNGFKGAVSFFNYLSKEHDYKFKELADFLYRVREARNELSQNKIVYNISQSTLEKLSKCEKACNAFSKLTFGKQLKFNSI